jgi:hypothetical protein
VSAANENIPLSGSREATEGFLRHSNRFYSINRERAEGFLHRSDASNPHESGSK